MDYINVKNTILPRIVKLCLEGSKDLKKHALLLLKNILPSLDKAIIADSLLPMLDNIRAQPIDQEINVILLELFRNVCQSVDIEVALSLIYY
jgi:hypothetical protein